MSQYSHLSRDELITHLESKEVVLERYRAIVEELERDVEYFEGAFEDAKDEVEHLRSELD